MNRLLRLYNIFKKKETQLFITALIVRVITAILFRRYFGLPFKLWNYETEGFNDFQYFYQTWVKHFTTLNWYPYSYNNEIDALNWYSYPPLFLYLLSLFGFFSTNHSAIPIILFDTLSVGMVYKILCIYIKNKESFLFSLFYSFSVVNLFYIDVYWLNPSPMIFFLLLSVFFLLKNNINYSIFTYVISVMMKQTGLYYGPLFLALFIGKKNIKNWWKPITLIILG